MFAIYACGFRPRCALEVDDSSENRLAKIESIIQQCRFGIHDISFMIIDPNTRLPRFNMPFELGIFMAAKRFGEGEQKRKVALILDSEGYRYRDALSDISGQDIQFHSNDQRKAIRIVRDWLQSCRQRQRLLGGHHIAEQYIAFSTQLPAASATLKLRHDELTYADTCRAIETWLKEHA